MKPMNLTSLAVTADELLRQTLSTAAVWLFAIALLLFVGIIIMRIMSNRATNARKKLLRSLSIPVYMVGIVVLVFAIFCTVRLNSLPVQMHQGTEPSQTTTPSEPSSTPTEVTEPSTVPTEPPTEPTVPPSFSTTPEHTGKTDPNNWGVYWEIIVNDAIVDDYTRPQNIFFGQSSSYFSLPGVISFRGNNYRDNATYGTADVTEEKLEKVWESEISSILKADGEGKWTGAGWTGQPLVVQWDAETRAIMNLYPEKKAKDGLVEVIYATLDGHIYFYDLETGDYTRDPMNVGMAFKGSGALDPRGYPILYVGSGDRTSEQKQPRMFIISLIDCTILYERGHSESYNLRSWRGFDASPLVSADTDTLIWPGENGLLYTIKLNTKYDKAAGTLSIKPDQPVMTRYSTDLGRSLGYEASPILVENYLYIGDNGGMFFCIDINTMELVWAQYIHDDLNATPVFEWGDDGKGYLYLATSMEYAEGTVYIYKINAANGEIVWTKTYTNVFYNKAVSGGALSSPLLGKKGTEMEGMILFTVARTPGEYEGVLVALDTETGEVLWEKVMTYTWSSPTAIHTKDGRAYVVLCDGGGRVHLIKGSTGEVLNTISIETNVEASPVVFNDMLVVGTRGQWVFGIKIQ